MSDLDYAKLGMKSGLEIHQQLDTHKLFCSCPSVLRQDEPEYVIKRKLHAVAGEKGAVDVAAEYQASLDKEFIYQAYDTTCLVELDEEPPHQINQEALKIAVQIAVLLNAKIFPITQIMRKTVIDGSNTSGFQRTILIARDGYLETSNGRVGIDSICLEEDAARIVSKDENSAIYRLDRLGIPLIEIATAPDMKTPEQVKEVALQIGNILRSLKVKRGLGTIRQDLNVSIKGGARTEIKGFQDPSMMIKTIENELKRQQEIISKGERVVEGVRNALKDGSTEFLRPMPGAERMYPETDLPLLKIPLDLINEAKKTLPKLRSEEEKELVKKGLNKDMITLLFKQNKLAEFKELLKEFDNPSLVAKILLMYPKEIASRENVSLERAEELLSREVLAFILESVKKKKILENDIKLVLEKVVRGEDVKEAIEIEKADVTEIEDEIRKLIGNKPGLSPNAYMGLVMKEFKGRVDGKTAIEIIKRYVK
ncbi:MAG TPA: Glu-tRNA(Gln) amidotransferase subunit GatE [Candidatus Nanoarchaeia archaeon]|nr:Glu-tRNA(Gln) amidotransferase subunit GatE [Candidatus Nanoarchaeia archaeon]